MQGINFNDNINHDTPPTREKHFTHQQRRTFSYSQKDECWNNVDIHSLI